MYVFFVCFFFQKKFSFIAIRPAYYYFISVYFLSLKCSFTYSLNAQLQIWWNNSFFVVVVVTVPFVFLLLLVVVVAVVVVL